MFNRYITTFIAITTSLWCAVPSSAQTDKMEHLIEFHASASNNHTPLWLNANKYGLSSLNSKYAYARGIVTYNNTFTPWGIDYKVVGDLVLPVNIKYQGYRNSEYRSAIILQQLFAEVRWKRIVLTGGAKQFESELVNNLLSSGAQTLGINARPIPQGRIALNDWWSVPYTHEWISIKGHIAFGIMSDANWEEKFIGSSGNRYCRWTRYHEKAGYLRFGNEQKSPLSLTLGLEMGAQFGGTLYNYAGTDQNGFRGSSALKLQSNLKSYWNAFIPGGGDTNESKYQNAEGNQLGSWLARLNWSNDNFSVGIYADHFFEDHSGLFFLDYDGYGTGEEWNVKKDFKFLAYPPKDCLLGLDLRLKKFKYIQGLTVEFLNSMYQSGAIYHDHNEGNPDHIGGQDNYYNHTTMPGWEHWGQTIGNPLYRSPQYNNDGSLDFKSNRFKAWHVGLNGSIIDDLNYRILYSTQKSYGTYFAPFITPCENTSFMVELAYRIPKLWDLRNMMVKLSYGCDQGELLGDNKGMQFTLQYNFKQ